MVFIGFPAHRRWFSASDKVEFISTRSPKTPFIIKFLYQSIHSKVYAEYRHNLKNSLIINFQSEDDSCLKWTYPYPI